MQAVLDSKDYDVITAEVLKRITAKYDLVPKHKKEEWLTLSEFKDALPIVKEKKWLTTFLLTKPVFKDWVINLNRGKGYKVKVNSLVLKWIHDHPSEINWNESLRRR